LLEVSSWVIGDMIGITPIRYPGGSWKYWDKTKAILLAIAFPKVFIIPPLSII